MEEQQPGTSAPEGTDVLAPPSGPGPRRAGGRLLRGFLVILLVVGLVLGIALGTAVLTGSRPWPWDPPAASRAPETMAPDTAAPTTAPAPPDRPTPGNGATRSPRGAAPAAPVGGGAHAFATFQTNGVTPVAYDPCRAVHYVIRPDQAPPGGEEMIHAAVARISEATGLHFVYDGATDEPLAPGREAFQPDRYGDRWAPVLIAWQTDAENTSLAGDIVGEGGSVAVSLGDGPRVYITGTVSLDAGQFPEILETRGGGDTAAGIVLHELAHLVGLAHVDDDAQLMYPETRRGVTDFSAGDLTGLSRLGHGPCVPEL